MSETKDVQSIRRKWFEHRRTSQASSPMITPSPLVPRPTPQSMPQPAVQQNAMVVYEKRSGTTPADGVPRTRTERGGTSAKRNASPEKQGQEKDDGSSDDSDDSDVDDIAAKIARMKSPMKDDPVPGTGRGQTPAATQGRLVPRAIAASGEAGNNQTSEAVPLNRAATSIACILGSKAPSTPTASSLVPARRSLLHEPIHTQASRAVACRGGVVLGISGTALSAENLTAVKNAQRSCRGRRENGCSRVELPFVRPVSRVSSRVNCRSCLRLCQEPTAHV